MILKKQNALSDNYQTRWKVLAGSATSQNQCDWRFLATILSFSFFIRFCWISRNANINLHNELDFTSSFICMFTYIQMYVYKQSQYLSQPLLYKPWVHRLGFIVHFGFLIIRQALLPLKTKSLYNTERCHLEDTGVFRTPQSKALGNGCSMTQHWLHALFILSLPQKKNIRKGYSVFTPTSPHFKRQGTKTHFFFFQSVFGYRRKKEKGEKKSDDAHNMHKVCVETSRINTPPITVHLYKTSIIKILASTILRMSWPKIHSFLSSLVTPENTFLSSGWSCRHITLQSLPPRGWNSDVIGWYSSTSQHTRQPNVWEEFLKIPSEVVNISRHKLKGRKKSL